VTAGDKCGFPRFDWLLREFVLVLFIENLRNRKHKKTRKKKYAQNEFSFLK